MTVIYKRGEQNVYPLMKLVLDHLHLSKDDDLLGKVVKITLREGHPATNSEKNPTTIKKSTIVAFETPVIRDDDWIVFTLADGSKYIYTPGFLSSAKTYVWEDDESLYQKLIRPKKKPIMVTNFEICGVNFEN